MNVAKGTAEALQEHGIQPSAQRVAVAEYVLRTHEHPSADLVWKRVRERFPWISRATVYNSLNLFVEKGLLRRLTFAEDSVVFDPRVDTHHHFIDDETGEIVDVPWEKVQVCNIESLRGYDISDYQVVMHGTRRKRQTKKETE
ncbi:MAG TPA: Fur family transcriptional regulator [Thermoanaerobaculia bacterium]|nr:Fur family transcriptional regulator [Thermoanaerobaculia bacterium]